MSYILTVSGIRIDPIHAAKEEIEIRDICHALSLLCRANGHVKYFFSVAQHSLNCYQEAKARSYTKRVQLACLLHDAAESYLADVTRPMKALMPEFKKAEDQLLEIIWEKYLDQKLSEEERKQVFDIDDDMLSYEFLHMMPESLSERHQNIQSTPNLAFQNPMDVEEEMLRVFEEL